MMRAAMGQKKEDKTWNADMQSSLVCMKDRDWQLKEDSLK